MYTPPAFREDDLATLHAVMHAARLCSFVTVGEGGLMATPLPMWLDADEGPFGTLYGHVARANPQWQSALKHEALTHEALAIFSGPDGYVSPAWYAEKAVSGKVVPTWNYVAVHAYGAPDFIHDADALLQIVTRLTDHHEAGRSERGGAWAVSDAPETFIRAQLNGIVGVRLPITRLEGKRKLSQNRSLDDQARVADGLTSSDLAPEQALGEAMRHALHGK